MNVNPACPGVYNALCGSSGSNSVHVDTLDQVKVTVYSEASLNFRFRVECCIYSRPFHIGDNLLCISSSTDRRAVSHIT